MKIRKATTKDADSIADIHTVGWQNGYVGVLSDKYLMEIVPKERRTAWKQALEYPKSNQCVFVEEYKGKIIGFVCVFLEEDPIWGSYIDNLYIDQSIQSKGVGKSLLVKAAQWCNEQSPKTGIYLFVNQNNKRAQKFYSRLGGHKKEANTWTAPDGTVIPTYRFIWRTLVELLKND